MKKLCRCIYERANNADISMASVVGWALLRRLRNRYPGDSFCGRNTIREEAFAIQLLDDAGAPSYFFSRIFVVKNSVKSAL